MRSTGGGEAGSGWHQPSCVVPCVVNPWQQFSGNHGFPRFPKVLHEFGVQGGGLGSQGAIDHPPPERIQPTDGRNTVGVGLLEVARLPGGVVHPFWSLLWEKPCQTYQGCVCSFPGEGTMLQPRNQLIWRGAGQAPPKGWGQDKRHFEME
eukprot:gene11202-biopygen13911